MKIPMKVCTVFLMLGITSLYSAAQDAGDQEAIDIQKMANELDADLTEGQVLYGKIASLDAADQNPMFYRQDERVFKILEDYDKLALLLAELPEGSTQKVAVVEYLKEFGKGTIEETDKALFDRIDNIKQQIVDNRTRLKELSGTELIATQAYVHSMELVRIRYYEALVNHLESRELLGLPTENLREQLGSRLYLYAEILAGRIEFVTAASTQLKERLAQLPDDVDIELALKELKARHENNVQRLRSLIVLLDRLGIDSSGYQVLLLEHASSISISLVSSNAIVTVLQNGWTALKDALKNNAPDLIFRFLLFILVLFIFKTLARLTRKVVRTATDRSKTDMSALLKNILVSISGQIVMALGVLMALSQVGVSLTPMLAGLGVAGFIVGFALQDSLGNFASGAMILIYRPFDVGDLVEVTGARGLVKKMNLVSTTIVTLDNQTLVVPNSKIWGDVIMNVTAQKVRRIDMEFGIAYEGDIELTERVLNEIVAAHDKILPEPEPIVRLHTLGDSSVNFIVRPWTKTENYWTVYWDLMREVKMRFDREGITIPFPQRDVHLYTENKDRDGCTD
jgi:small conductance mechanosensitive channel